MFSQIKYSGEFFLPHTTDPGLFKRVCSFNSGFTKSYNSYMLKSNDVDTDEGCIPDGAEDANQNGL